MAVHIPTDTISADMVYDGRRPHPGGPKYSQAPLQKGDVVRLKSGGEIMTVSDVSANGEVVQTLWMTPAGEVKTEGFEPVVLDRAR